MSKIADKDPRCRSPSNLSLQLESVNRLQVHQSRQGGNEIDKVSVTTTAPVIPVVTKDISPVKGAIGSNHVILRRLHQNDSTKGSSGVGGGAMSPRLMNPATSVATTSRTRFVIPLPKQRQQQPTHKQRQTSYLNETAFLQELEQKRRLSQKQQGLPKNNYGNKKTFESSFERPHGSPPRSLNSPPPCPNAGVIAKESDDDIQDEAAGAAPPFLAIDGKAMVEASVDTKAETQDDLVSHQKQNSGKGRDDECKSASSSTYGVVPEADCLLRELSQFHHCEEEQQSHRRSPLSLSPSSTSSAPPARRSSGRQNQVKNSPQVQQQPHLKNHLMTIAASFGFLQQSLFGGGANSSVKEDGNEKKVHQPHERPALLDECGENQAELSQSCRNCETLQAKFDAALDDIDYLKSIIQQQEINRLRQTCLQHQNTSLTSSLLQHQIESNQKNLRNREPDSATASTYLRSETSSASSLSPEQLQEITTRHKKQIQQLMKEALKLQQDFFSKQHKLTYLCRGLNDESSTRKHETETLEDNLMRITNERDDLALENMQLRASLDVRLNEIAQLESIRDKYERERVTTCEPND